MFTASLSAVSVCFLLFLVFLNVIVHKKKKKSYIKIIAAFLCVVQIALFAYQISGAHFITAFEGMQNYKMHEAVYTFYPLADSIYFLLIIGIMTVIYHCVQRRVFYQVTVLICLGGISRILMGFSPTVWASGVRTFAIIIIALIFSAVLIIQDIPLESEHACATHIPKGKR